MSQHSLTLSALFGVVLTPYSLAEIRVASGAEISINGQVTTNTIRIENGGTLSCAGHAKGTIITESGGILSPGGSPGIFTTTGTTTLAGTLRCEVDSSDSDQLTTQGTLDLSGATLQLDNLSGGNLQPVYLLASYGSLSGVSFSQVINLPPGYVIDYSYFDGSNLNNIALTANTAPYQTWALSSGLTPGVNDGINNDPNQDGIPNLIHFAYNTNPLGNGSSEGKRQISAIQIGDEQYLSITFPARVGATFSGAPGLLATVDGVRLGVRGNGQLDPAWDLPLVELFPALDGGLPPLGDSDGDGSADWEYRTFRLSEPMSLHPNSFLQLSVEQTP